MIRLARAIAYVALLSCLTSAASAQDDEVSSPFDRRFAFGGYLTGQAGSYRGAGLGGRARWEPLPRFGVEVYAEAVVVDSDGDGFRHDYPNGFNLYVPFERGRFRVRPFFGFCDVLSFLRPSDRNAPRANDVLIGVHAGVGGELAIRPRTSLFVDLQTNVYTGHGRTAQGWTGGVDGEFAFFWNLQLNLGVQFHAGR